MSVNTQKIEGAIEQLKNVVKNRTFAFECTDDLSLYKLAVLNCDDTDLTNVFMLVSMSKQMVMLNSLSKQYPHGPNIYVDEHFSLHIKFTDMDELVIDMNCDVFFNGRRTIPCPGFLNDINIVDYMNAFLKLFIVLSTIRAKAGTNNIPFVSAIINIAYTCKNNAMPHFFMQFVLTSSSYLVIYNGKFNKDYYLSQYPWKLETLRDYCIAISQGSVIDFSGLAIISPKYCVTNYEIVCEYAKNNFYGNGHMIDSNLFYNNLYVGMIKHEISYETSIYYKKDIVVFTGRQFTTIHVDQKWMNLVGYDDYCCVDIVDQDEVFLFLELLEKIYKKIEKKYGYNIKLIFPNLPMCITHIKDGLSEIGGQYS